MAYEHTQERYPCPCCGYQVFRHQPGSHVTCPICGWEDDMGQLRFPLMTGAANTESLQRSQQNYADYGASCRRAKPSVRTPTDMDQRDPLWRPLDTNRDNAEIPQRGQDYMNSYPADDSTVLYYWRDTYWRRLAS